MYNSDYYNRPWQQGWLCPKCNAVLSPKMDFCPFCSRNNMETYYSITTNPNQKESIITATPRTNWKTFTIDNTNRPTTLYNLIDEYISNYFNTADVWEKPL